MFFHYSQNNSGGRFKYSKSIGEHVVIEAIDYLDANDIAESIGLYFDGEGDCSCCGRRWSDQNYWDKGTEQPTIYGHNLEEYKSFFQEKGLIKTDSSEPMVVVHYKNGVIETYNEDS